jgi:hypothetical protein
VNFFEKLLEAQTETEFFVIISTLLNHEPIPRIRAVMSSTQEGNELILRLTLEQTLAYLQPNQRNHVFRAETTHIFTLTQSGKLTWWMKGQPTRVGLKNIQAALKMFHESILTPQLPSQV